ncbi:MAG TPA: SRPBCC domain-containing protein [Candidatus Acidoferrales bacterium]|nr:SRPBCC domain-containing protein [Candidatus Acidoferrales bacterium]
MAATSSMAESKDRELVFTRVFDAPRELVWKAWTEPAHVSQWWGPRGFTTTIHDMDLRPGGIWRQTMHGPDGTYPSKHVFIEVVKHERISYTLTGGKEGDPVHQLEQTWTFEAQGDKTKLTLRMLFPSAEAMEQIVKTYGVVEGAKETLDRLGEHLPTMSGKNSYVAGDKEREVVITRVFDAPRELVFKAWTDPRIMKEWYGPKMFTNSVCELDVRVGGAWRIVMRGPDGAEYPGRGVYREIVKPERLVFTSDATDKDGNVILAGLATVTFAEEGGKTKLTLRVRATAMVDYAVAYLAGMEAGWSQSLDGLAEELARGHRTDPGAAPADWR